MTVPPPRQNRYIPSLDGLRAMAVGAVLLYHGGIGWAQGGFLGVDLFFVLSGYLITSLLLGEHSSSGRIALGRFWARRARRLLPALFVMLAGVAVYAAVLAPPDGRADLRRAALATLAYVANWNQIAGGQGYFAQLAAPTPLLHTWSLAIEEQFYVLWPLLLAGLLSVSRRFRRSPLFPITLAGALASAVTMAVLYGGGAGVNRVYYGTDTRAQDLLIGAALSVAPLAVRRRLGSVGALGLAGLLAAIGLATGSSGWLYHGGFLGLAVASAVLIAAVTRDPVPVWARPFSLPPLRYLGRISYGLYLYHWPLYLVLDHARTGLSGAPLLVVRLAASAGAAAASFHLVEEPVRRGVLSRHRAWIGAPAAAGAVAAALVIGTVAPAGTAAAQPVPTGTSGVAPGTDAAVASIPAGTGGPVRALLVGDSSAAVLSLGLAPPSAYGVDVQTDAVIGCGLLTPGLVSNRGVVAAESGGLRGSQWVRCDTWRQRWSADVQAFHPAVAILMEGAWEVRDRYLAGRWQHLGQAGLDAMELADLEQAITTLRSGGTAVLVVTSPYYLQPEQPDGSPQPADDPARVDRYNALARQAAARAGATVVDLGAWLCPAGRYTSTIGGVQVRDGDGIHVTAAGARLIEPRLMAAVEVAASRHGA